MKKIQMVMFVFLISITAVFAQGSKETTVAPVEENKTEIFVDSLGRQVEIPSNIERVSPSGNLSQQIVYSLVPNKMVGWGTRPTEAMAKYFSQEILNKPVFGAFYGAKANLNLEAVIFADPQIIIDIGEVKGSKENMISDLDKLQDNLGIPVVFISAHLDSMGDTYRDLGALLKVEEDAKKRADFCDETIALANNATSTLNEDEKVSVYYGSTSNGLLCYPKGSFHTQVLPLIGAINAVEGKGKQITVSPEQLMIWNPDLVILTQEGGYESFTEEDSPFKSLSAVESNKLFIIPEGPFSWIDKPPAMNRILGIKWLGNLIYPDKFDIDIIEEAKTFYNLFYHYELTTEEAKQLLNHSMR